MTNYEMDENEFLALFKEKVPISDEPPQIPSKITFAKGALDKAFAIGKVIDDITWGNYEWHGVILVNKDDPLFIVRDILIAEGAQIAPGATNLDAQALTKAVEGVTKLNQEKGTNYTIIGVIHSHGNGGVGHSLQDDEAFRHVIGTYCGATQKHFRSPVSLIEGQKEQQINNGDLVLSGSNLEDAVLKLTPPGEEKLREILRSQEILVPPHVKDVRKAALEILLGSEVYAKQTISSGFAYSVVVNLSKNTYGEIGVREFETLRGQERIRTISDAVVETIEVENDVTYKEDELLDEATNKFVFVTGKGGGLKWRFGNLVRVWSAQKKRYVWKKEETPKSMWAKPAKRSTQVSEPAEEGGIISGVLNALFPETLVWNGEQHYPSGPTEPVWYCGQSAQQQFQEVKPKEPEIIDKIKDKSIVNLDDLAWQFVFSSLGYVSNFRSGECIYSEYFGYVIDLMSDYSQKYDKMSLREAFKAVYIVFEGIKPDQEKIAKPALSKSLYWLHKKISENLNRDEDQIAFMISFSGAKNLEEQNKLINEYSAKFNGEKDDSKRA